ncbi:MAG TPA: phosphoethanolamine transferase domain-containing protein [Patescibacteria group bacterium]|nr:phosphoethanolamine transferase domain-containing protein [Patescibacteria group bacterium]
MILLSSASAFSYFLYMGQGIIVGALFGLPGREADVATAQRSATIWLVASACCLGIPTLAGALAIPIDEDESWFSQLIPRLALALVVSFVLAVLIGLVSFSIISAFRHSVVR